MHTDFLVEWRLHEWLDKCVIVIALNVFVLITPG